MTMTDLSWESKLAEENIKKARKDERQKRDEWWKKGIRKLIRGKYSKCPDCKAENKPKCIESYYLEKLIQEAKK